MVWWYWMVLGLALLGAEMTTPGGFYILFFGLSALLVGTMTGLDIVNVDWLQWLLFSVIAIGSLLVFRGPLLARMNEGRKAHPEVDSMVGEVAVPLEALPAGATASWNLAKEYRTFTFKCGVPQGILPTAPIRFIVLADGRVSARAESVRLREDA